jgi:hypothetical protein
MWSTASPDPRACADIIACEPRAEQRSFETAATLRASQRVPAAPALPGSSQSVNAGMHNGRGEEGHRLPSPLVKGERSVPADAPCACPSTLSYAWLDQR